MPEYPSELGQTACASVKTFYITFW